MIKKILVRDYLKGYDKMTAEERKAFVGRVGEWLVRDGMRLLTLTDRPMARSQSLMTITTRWTAEDTKAMTDGILLMSALVGVADTWLPTQIYMKSAYRAVRQVVSVLSEVKSEELRVKNFLRPDGSMQPGVERNIKAGASKEESAAGTKKATQAVGAKATPVNRKQNGGAVAAQQQKPLPMIKTVGTEYNAATDTLRVQCAVVPARPKHIDQYVHLLPKATQERASQYGELMRQLGEARDNMQLLMDDDHASAKSREQWAKQATRIDKKIRVLREELDREWEKVAESGRVEIDDLGMAHLVSVSQCNATQNEDSTAADGEGCELEPAELTSEQRKRRRDLRKWLIDLRRGKEGKDREKRIEQWRVNWQEYLTLEPRGKALEDEKILEAAKHFGIDLTQIVTN